MNKKMFFYSALFMFSSAAQASEGDSSVMVVGKNRLKINPNVSQHNMNTYVINNNRMVSVDINFKENNIKLSSIERSLEPFVYLIKRKNLSKFVHQLKLCLRPYAGLEVNPLDSLTVFEYYLKEQDVKEALAGALMLQQVAMNQNLNSVEVVKRDFIKPSGFQATDIATLGNRISPELLISVLEVLDIYTKSPGVYVVFNSKQGISKVGELSQQPTERVSSSDDEDSTNGVKSEGNESANEEEPIFLKRSDIAKAVNSLSYFQRFCIQAPKSYLYQILKGAKYQLAAGTIGVVALFMLYFKIRSK